MPLGKELLDIAVLSFLLVLTFQVIFPKCLYLINDTIKT